MKYIKKLKNTEGGKNTPYLILLWHSKNPEGIERE
jgi:hypothetical protein